MELKEEKVITFDELVNLLKQSTEESNEELVKYKFVIDSEIIISNKPIEMYHLKFLDLKLVNCTIVTKLSRSKLWFNFSTLKVSFINCYIDCDIVVDNCKGYIDFENSLIVQPIHLNTYKQVLETMDGIKDLTHLILNINNSSLKSKLGDNLTNTKMLNIKDYGNIYRINILHNSYIESIFLDQCEKLRLNHSTIKQFISITDLADLKNLELCVSTIIREEKPATLIMNASGPYDKRNLTKSYINGVFLDKSIIGYKKVCVGSSFSVGTREFAIVKLRIPKGAIVFSNNLYKCRTNKAKVLDILIDGKSIKESAWYKNTRFTSSFDENFTYSIGDNLSVKDFCLINSDVCASGIHFFLTKEEAEKYYIF